MKQPGYDFILQSLGTEIGVHLLRQLTSNLPAYKEDKVSKPSIYRVIEYLSEQQGDSYSLEDLSREAGLSIFHCFMCGFNNHSHFSTLFKNRTGVTPSQYRKMCR